MGGSPPHVATGPVDYPAYMKSWHELALASTGESLDVSLTGAMNETFANNPYDGLTLIDTDDILLGGKSLSQYNVPFSTLSSFALLDLASVIDSFRAANQLSHLQQDTNPLVDSITQASLDETAHQAEREALANYKANLRSVNAVMSSSFVVGEALLRGNKVRTIIEEDITQRQIAIQTQVRIVEQAEELNLRSSVASMEMRLGILQMIASFSKLYTTVKLSLEVNNLEIVAKESLWGLQVFQYGGNFLGAIHGKTAAWLDPGESSVPLNYAGGIISGISMGAKIGSIWGPIGTVIGAVLGAIMGAIMGYIASNYGYASAQDAAIHLPMDVFSRGSFLQRFLIFGFGW